MADDKREKAWVKLLQKMSSHQARGGTMILSPDEVVLLNAKLYEITAQLMATIGWIEKYKPLMSQIAKVEESVQSGSASGGRLGSDQEEHPGDDGVDPEDLHNSLTPERSGPVAGGASA